MYTFLFRSQFLKKMWYISTVFLLLLLLVSPAIAAQDTEGNETSEEAGEVIGTDHPDCFREALKRNFIWTSPCDVDITVSCGTFSGIVTTTTVPEETKQQFESVLPRIQELQPTYEAVAQEFNIPWQVLAALHYRESTNNPDKSMFSGEKIGTPTRYTNGLSNAVYGTTLEENIRLATQFLLEGLPPQYEGRGTPIAKIGYPELDLEGRNFGPDDIKKLFLAWFAGGAYRTRDISPDDVTYVMNGFDADHLNMEWDSVSNESGTDGQLGAYTVFVLLNGGTASGCGGGTFGEIAFPLQTTKSIIETGTGFVWSKNNNGHKYAGWGENYIAYDIAVPAGTPVLAAVAGTVRSSKNTSSGREANLWLEGDNGIWYYYTHMSPSTKIVSTDDKVEKGQQIGTIGRYAANAASGANTPPHLHFSASTQRIGAFRRGCPRSSCPDMDKLIDYLEPLLAAYELLPE